MASGQFPFSLPATAVLPAQGRAIRWLFAVERVSRCPSILTAEPVTKAFSHPCHGWTVKAKVTTQQAQRPAA